MFEMATAACARCPTRHGRCEATSRGRRASPSPPRSRAADRCWSRSRRWSRRRVARARGGRRRARRSGSHCCSPCWGGAPGRPLRPRRLRQHRRRPAHRRAGHRPAARGRAGVVAARPTGPPAPWPSARSALLGELRPCRRAERRLREAARLGFRRAVVPRDAPERRGARPRGIEGVAVATLREALAAGTPAGARSSGRGSPIEVGRA